MSQINDAKILKMAQFFIANFQYLTLNVDNRQDELWLFNSEHVTYSLIRISCKSLSQVTYEKQRLDASIKVIRESLKLEHKFLDIHLGQEEVLEDEVFDSVSIEDHYYSGLDLEPLYPGFKCVSLKVDDPQEEIKKISFDLVKRKKNTMSKIFKNGFKPTATYTIIAICALVFCLSLLLNNLQAQVGIVNATNNSAIVLGAFYKELIVIAHEYWRFLTVGFVHVDPFHFLMNMFAMYNLGLFFERNYGKKNLLLILFGSTIGGSIFIFLGSENGITVGLSGGLYGLMASMIVHLWYTGLIKQPAIRSQIISLLLINAFITFMPGISMLGHIGGFITGLLLSITLIKDEKLKSFINNAKISLAIGLAVVFYFIIQTKTIYPEYGTTDYAVAKVIRLCGLDFYADYLEAKITDYYIPSK